VAAGIASIMMPAAAVISHWFIRTPRRFDNL
jgi:hypothetical protein